MKLEGTTEPIQKLQKLMDQATDLVGDGAKDKNITFPLIGGVIGYFLGEKRNKEAIGAILGGLSGLVVASLTKDSKQSNTDKSAGYDYKSK